VWSFYCIKDENEMILKDENNFKVANFIGWKWIQELFEEIHEYFN